MDELFADDEPRGLAEAPAPMVVPWSRSDLLS
jgi:hypothetical protein